MKKYDTFYCFNKFIDSVDYQKESKIRCLGTDNAGEYTSNELKDFCSEHDLDRKCTVADTPQKNRVVEQMNRILMEQAGCMLSAAGLK